MAINSFGKRNVLMSDLDESREGFCRRGRGRSFHAEGPKTEKARKPTAGSLVRATWRQPQKQSGEYERACKVEDSHRDKTEQYA